MRLFFPRKRATALIQSGPPDDPERLHLFIMMTDPIGDDEVLLAVSVCSINDGQYHDAACELGPNDHEFLKGPSYVLYSHARLMRAETLMNGVNAKAITPQGTITKAVFLRICEGFDKSVHVRPKIRKFIEDLND